MKFFIIFFIYTEEQTFISWKYQVKTNKKNDNNNINTVKNDEEMDFQIF